MKRFLLFTLVIGLFSVQADAALYDLDAPTARLFTQLSSNSSDYELQLVIDSPGVFGSTTYLEIGGFNGQDDAVQARSAGRRSIAASSREHVLDDVTRRQEKC